jgi:hypothetical protein
MRMLAMGAPGSKKGRGCGQDKGPPEGWTLGGPYCSAWLEPTGGWFPATTREYTSSYPGQVGRKQEGRSPARGPQPGRRCEVRQYQRLTSARRPLPQVPGGAATVILDAPAADRSSPRPTLRARAIPPPQNGISACALWPSELGAKGQGRTALPLQSAFAKFFQPPRDPCSHPRRLYGNRVVVPKVAGSSPVGHPS